MLGRKIYASGVVVSERVSAGLSAYRSGGSDVRGRRGIVFAGGLEAD